MELLFPQRDTDEEVKEHLRNNLHLQEKVMHGKTMRTHTGRLLASGCHLHASFTHVFLETVSEYLCYIGRTSSLPLIFISLFLPLLLQRGIQ